MSFYRPLSIGRAHLIFHLYFVLLSVYGGPQRSQQIHLRPKVPDIQKTLRCELALYGPQGGFGSTLQIEGGGGNRKLHILYLRPLPPRQ